MDCKQVGILTGGKWDKMHDCIRRVYDTDALSPTITSGGGGHHEVKIMELKPKLVGGIGEKKSNGGTQYYQQDRVYDSDGIAMAHPASITDGSYKYAIPEEGQVRVRKLTPKECWRLMGFDDTDIDRAKAVGTSDTQLYKQAGNSIVVDVLYHIFKELL